MIETVRKLTSRGADRLIGKLVKITDVSGDVGLVTVTHRDRYCIYGTYSSHNVPCKIDRTDIKDYLIVG